jgi:hypothetical protein
MNETTWLRAGTLLPLLVYLRGTESPPPQPCENISLPEGTLYGGSSPRLSPRKLRLFALACCRRLWRFPLDEVSRTILAAFGRYAEGKTGWGEYRAVCDTFVRPLQSPPATSVYPLSARRWTDEATGAFRAAREASWIVASRGAPSVPTWVLDTCASFPDDWDCRIVGVRDPAWQAARNAEEKEQVELLRHVIGNPFRPVAVDPAWLYANDGVAHKIVQVIHGEQRYEDLPFLADALEDAGCTNTDLLDHCRGPGPHFRGCWAVDLLVFGPG